MKERLSPKARAKSAFGRMTKALRELSKAGFAVSVSENGTVVLSDAAGTVVAVCGNAKIHVKIEDL